MAPENWIAIASGGVGYLVAALIFVFTMRARIAVLESQLKHLVSEVNELRKIIYQLLSRGDCERNL